MIKATLHSPALRKRARQFGRLVRHSAVTPLCGETHKPRLASNGEMGIPFIGHSGFFVQMGGKSVMIDPNFARWLFLLKRLRRPGLRVLLTSGYAEAFRTEAEAEGLRILSQPFQENHLVSALTNTVPPERTAPLRH